MRERMDFSSKGGIIRIENTTQLSLTSFISSILAIRKTLSLEGIVRLQKNFLLHAKQARPLLLETSRKSAYSGPRRWLQKQMDKRRSQAIEVVPSFGPSNYLI
jgi:hypothetical protein